jgi:hypothetical protein
MIPYSKKHKKRKPVFSIATPKVRRSNPDAPNNAKKATPNNVENYPPSPAFELLITTFIKSKLS